MFKVLDEKCTPTRGTKYSACIDLYASEDVVIGAGETRTVGLGIAIDEDKIIEIAKKSVFDIDLYNEDEILEYFVNGLKERHYFQLMLRSSLGKKGLILPNGVGVIDIDYKDEIKMIIHNPVHHFSVELSDEDINHASMGDTQDLDTYAGVTQYIKKGDKIGQITLLEHKAYLFGIETDVERDGGFGSTNKGDER